MTTGQITGQTTGQTAEAILIAHQRFDCGSCLCGWSELGKSHPAHQVAMLQRAGLLHENTTAATADDTVIQIPGPT